MLIEISGTGTVFIQMRKTDSREPKRGSGRPRTNTDAVQPFVKTLTEWRLRNGLSQPQLAAVLLRLRFPISFDTVRSWEEGRRTPRAHAVEILKQIIKENPNISL
jgi:DNA-binding transcriptional regulator YiaG